MQIKFHLQEMKIIVANISFAKKVNILFRMDAEEICTSRVSFVFPQLILDTIFDPLSITFM